MYYCTAQKRILFHISEIVKHHRKILYSESDSSPIKIYKFISHAISICGINKKILKPTLIIKKYFNKNQIEFFVQILQ